MTGWCDFEFPPITTRGRVVHPMGCNRVKGHSGDHRGSSGDVRRLATNEGAVLSVEVHDGLDGPVVAKFEPQAEQT